MSQRTRTRPAALRAAAPLTVRIQRLPIARVNPAPDNPRKDLAPGDPEYARLARSIDEFGLVEPLVWNTRTGHLVGGHQRFEVLLARGADARWESPRTLLVNRERVADMVARCRERKGRLRWEVELAENVMPDWVFIARLDRAGSGIEDYCLIAGGYCMISLGDIRHRLLFDRGASAELGPLIELVLRGKPKPGTRPPGVAAATRLGARVRDRLSMYRSFPATRPRRARGRPTVPARAPPCRRRAGRHRCLPDGVNRLSLRRARHCVWHGRAQ